MSVFPHLNLLLVLLTLQSLHRSVIDRTFSSLTTTTITECIVHYYYTLYTYVCTNIKHSLTCMYIPHIYYTTTKCTLNVHTSFIRI